MDDKEKVYLFKVSLNKKIYREMALKGRTSLYAFAKEIVSAFDFEFDHAFGFYDNIKDQLCFLNFLNLVLLQLLFIILYSCSIEKCIFGNKSPSLYRKEFMSNSYHYLGFMVNEYVL